MDTFASIVLKRWRQFETVELDLRPQLCVLTGPNGCGKTTILNLLGRHFGWNLSFLTASFVTDGIDVELVSSLREATTGTTEGRNLITVTLVGTSLHFRIVDAHGKAVVDSDETGLREQAQKIDALRTHLTSLWPPHELTKSEKGRIVAEVASIVGRSFSDKKRIDADAWDVLQDQVERGAEIGTLTYTSGHMATINTPAPTLTQYQVQINGQKEVHGLHIPSHRPPPGYARLETIPINPKSAQQHYQAYQAFLFQSYGEQPQRNPSVAMKEALIGFAVFGEGNRSVRSNAEYVEILLGFEEVLRRLLPDCIGFETIEIETPDVVLITKSGRFPLESMSGGLNALFGIAWQIHMHAAGAMPCTVLIDEPENHLHPSMQREFLPRLVEAFPSHKFIVATHSPFVVSSTPDAAVYALLYDKNRRVTSKLLADSDLAASPNKVLREVLDVPVTMPVWVERRLQEILARFQGVTFDKDTIARLRTELSAEGLEEAFGDFLAQPTSQDEVV